MQERAALLAGATTPNAGRRPQPFVMHKMAFHRGRALGIIRRTLHSSLPANTETQAGACLCLLSSAYSSCPMSWARQGRADPEREAHCMLSRDKRALKHDSSGPECCCI